MTGRAIIAGGSIGGLFAALMLRRAGWQVQVLERTEVELKGRGAGIVTHDLLNRMIVMAGASIADLGVPVADRVVYDVTGAEIARRPLPQIVTSWDRVHSLLRALLGPNEYLLGAGVTGYREKADGVEVLTSDGRVLAADLLVGADGFRSAVRGQMLPEVQPIYAGYVVWRALAPEAALSEAVARDVFPHFAFYIPTGTQVVGYPIAGPGNDLRPGHRQYNFVWYAPVPDGELADMLTDATGQRHAISIPPPLVRPEVARAGMERAEAMLPPPFVEILRAARQAFFTPIYDHVSPVFAQGRVALLGDAACVARPHVGMGVTKAACDAEALARHLSAAATVEAALAAYSEERQPEGAMATRIARELGAMIFAPPAQGRNTDGRNNPNQETIVMDTAVVPPALDRLPA